jgi:putative inorganic carbon (hco3(-)) transporter
LNTTPGNHFTLRRLTWHSVKYFSARAAIILLFSLIIGAVVIVRPFLPGKWGLLLLLGFTGIFGLMIIGNVKKVLLAVILIDIPLRWDVYLGARSQNATLGMREGWLISLTTVALVILLIVHIVKELVRAPDRKKLLFTENIPLVLYIAFTCLSAIVAIDTLGALFQVFFLAQMFLLYVYVSSNVNSIKDIQFIILFLFLGLFLEDVVVLAQRLAGFQVNIMGIITVVDNGRMAGTLGSPNTAAAYFSLLLVPALSIYLSKTLRRIRYLAIIAFILGTVALVFTISRGGLIAFIVSLIIFGFVMWFRGKISPWVAFFILFAATLVTVIFGGLVFDRLITLRESAALARIPLMKIAWNMILAHPFLGVGANNYAMNLKFYLLPQMTQGFLYVVHNKYLLIWAETGLGGILSFVGFLGLTLWRGWKTYTRDIPVYSLLSLGFAAAIAGQMTHMMVEIFDSRTEIQALWIAVALIAAMERITREGKPDEN